MKLCEKKYFCRYCQISFNNLNEKKRHWSTSIHCENKRNVKNQEWDYFEALYRDAGWPTRETNPSWFEENKDLVEKYTLL